MDSSRALIELQDVDLRLRRTNLALKEIPEGAQVAEVRARLRELARRTTKITGTLKDNEMSAEDNASQRQELVHRVEQINEENKTADFRRAKDNNAELDRIAKRLEKLDYLAGNIEIEIKRLRELEKKSALVKKSLEAKELELLRALKSHAQQTMDEITRLNGERESIVASIPESLLAQYEQSSKKHGGVGVARLENGTCTGCGVQLQPSQVDALRAQSEDVATCPVCGRMLVVRGA